jgi:hypothetical protein
MGVKSNVTGTVPTASHATAALNSGRSALSMHMQAGKQIDDTVNLLQQCIRDMTKALPFTVSGATLANGGGSGYVANEVLTLANGVQIKVLTVTGGAVTTFSVQTVGSFTGAAPPSNPQSQIQTTGSGSGAQFNLTWASADVNVATFLNAISALS